ncbi:hypothetical protein CANTEDRAFT_113289 [Yamadazyma tenuis ATCC 10573]|uniref:Uncharacterized protein n=1 Tax=Candida tenuis (strain ATCC 10573 / BCRC 21748 / CBS 615 / JCM 9827 / NBRC 10315 / NRRL Y-1498 / VKM Y-70) TaxID=590646 RepID=G3B1T4_CANTC|nr:uncharacterized protein CANTEDRAFT_113289 [Yamadazyma tenuis ATCC 10573]EGV64528.1 hypothetical protein CANTEDRAFT_113289 [Yamadazyma tenuis ATCC 10573]
MLQCLRSKTDAGEKGENKSKQETACTILEQLNEFKSQSISTQFEELPESILCVVDDYTKTGGYVNFRINSRVIDWAFAVANGITISGDPKRYWVTRTFVVGTLNLRYSEVP